MKVRIQIDRTNLVKVTILDSNGVKIEDIPDEIFSLSDFELEDDVVLDFDGKADYLLDRGL